MATSIIDLQRCIALIQNHLLGISALTSVCDVQRQDEPMGDGVSMPAVGIGGIDDVQFAEGTENGADACALNLILLVQHEITDFTTQRYTAEGVVSLLRKSLKASPVAQDTGASVGGQTTGHVIHLMHGPQPMRVYSGNRSEEDQATRVYEVHIACTVGRTGTGLQIEA